MEGWFVIVTSLCTAALIKSILNFISKPRNAKAKLPPGPFTLPFIGSLMLFRKSLIDLESVLRDLHSKIGPVVALRLGSHPSIFVSSRSLAHQALIVNSAVFADRPPAVPTVRIMSSNQHKINTASYGPKWRALRRNLMVEILHPARVRSYSHARRWVLEILLDRIHSEPTETVVRVVDHFQYAMFCLLALMCFGYRLEEETIREIESVQRMMLLRGFRFNIVNFWPRLGKILFRQLWEEFHQLQRNQAAVLLPLITARREARHKSEVEKEHGKEKNDVIICYVDTLIDLQLPNEKRLTESEILALCSEFLNGGIETTTTALQWIMANLVKYPCIQARLFEEIRDVVRPSSTAALEEEDLQKLPYLKAVVLEGLRRHPPSHFLLSHAVTEDTELGGYVIPKNGSVNFMVAQMGLDPTAWEEPMEFRPERFLNSQGNGIDEGFDITGTREIKMMPFGAGRRMCPGFNLALLHLEYFVANLVWAFEWRAVDGDELDFSEEGSFIVAMKNQLKAVVSPRQKA